MIAEERRRKLLELVQEKGKLSVDELSRRMQVSRMTVHRDLDQLAAAGLLRKLRGGAAPVLRQATVILPFTQRQLANAEAKSRIAEHLLKTIEGGKTIAFDASTTVFALSQILPSVGPDVERMIMTNGLPLFLELRKRNIGGRLMITGGEPLGNDGSLVGPMAIKSLEGIRFDFVVVSAGGYMQERGEVYDTTPESAAFKQALLSRARKTILAIDRNKLNFLAPYTVCRIDQFDLLVTETGPQEIKHSRRAIAE